MFLGYTVISLYFCQPVHLHQLSKEEAIEKHAGERRKWKSKVCVCVSVRPSICVGNFVRNFRWHFCYLLSWNFVDTLIIFQKKSIENIMGKGENADNQISDDAHFLQCFQHFMKLISNVQSYLLHHLHTLSILTYPNKLEGKGNTGY